VKSVAQIVFQLTFGMEYSIIVNKYKSGRQEVKEGVRRSGYQGSEYRISNTEWPMSNTEGQESASSAQSAVEKTKPISFVLRIGKTKLEDEANNDLRPRVLNEDRVRVHSSSFVVPFHRKMRKNLRKFTKTFKNRAHNSYSVWRMAYIAGDLGVHLKKQSQFPIFF